jgi:ParB-like chromosome segregation protein Spo0J
LLYKDIKKGLKVYRQSTDGFLDIAENLKKKKVVQPMILLKSSKDEKLVIVEGHARLTAYSLMNFEYAEYYDVIVGIADKAETEAWIHY